MNLAWHRLRFTVALLALLALACVPRRSYRSAKKEVSLQSIEPSTLDPILSKTHSCPGSKVALAVALTLEDREILAAPRGMSENSFPKPLRERLAAALATKEFVELDELDIKISGPASLRNGVIAVSGDLERVLEGPVRVKVRSPHHPALSGEAVIAMRLDCNYKFVRSGQKGALGQTGAKGRRGNPDGTPGGGGGPGGDGGRGPSLEVRAAPISVPGGGQWIQATARDLRKNTEQRYLLAPGSHLTVGAYGGKGGEGGRGGEGGFGTDVSDNPPMRAGDGGTGGAGGNGGRGGPGGDIRIIVSPELESRLESFIRWSVVGGDGGDGGRAGRGGGNGNYYLDGSGRESIEGRDGTGGAGGPPGPDGKATVETQRLKALFSVDMGKLQATLKAMKEAPTVAKAPSERGPKTTKTSSHSKPPPRPRPPTGRATPPAKPEGSELGTGRFPITVLNLRRHDGKQLISLARDGTLTMGRASVIGRIQGGTIVRDGKVLMALSKNGTLHVRGRNGFQAVAVLQPNGRVSWKGRPLSLQLESGGRIVQTAKNKRNVLKSKFTKVPKSARITAAFMLYMAAGGLR